MPKSKNRKNQKVKSKARTQSMNAQKSKFQKTMTEMMMKQIEEIKSNSSGETENQSTQDSGLIQSTTEL